MPITQHPDLCALLDAAISTKKLTQYRDAIFEAAEPCILLYAGDDSSDTPIGATRIGGLPDLPPDLPWPVHDGAKIPFIAQLNLRSLPKYDENPLPASGWLYFFVVANDEYPIPTRVLYYDGDEQTLTRHAQPAAGDVLEDWTGETVYATVPVVETGLSVSLDIDELCAAHSFSHSENVRLIEMVDDLSPSENYGDRRGVEGQVLGMMNYPDASPTDAAEYGGLQGDDWMHLLEIQSAGSMMWSDCGMLNFLIRRSQLLQRDFSDVYSTIYSS